GGRVLQELGLRRLAVGRRLRDRAAAVPPQLQVRAPRKSRDGGGDGGCGNCKNTVSYKIRRSWSEGSLALAAAATSGAGSGSSPSCSSNSSPHAAGALARSMSRDDLASYSGSR
ncbi:unnamed protein product, partial [Linum tenue]